MAEQFRALVDIAKDLLSVPSTCMVAKSCLSEGIQWGDPGFHGPQAYTCAIQTHIWVNIHTHKKRLVQFIFRNSYFLPNGSTFTGFTVFSCSCLGTGKWLSSSELHILLADGMNSFASTNASGSKVKQVCDDHEIFYWTTELQFKVIILGAGETVYQLRALAAFLEEQSFVSSSHVGWLSLV